MWILAISLAIVGSARAEEVAGDRNDKPDVQQLGEHTDLPIRVLRNLTYAEAAGQRLAADIYMPAGDGPFPAVVMLHGGAWMSGRKEQLSWHARQAARKGLAAVSINYRLAPKHLFPAQLEDAAQAVRWVAQHGRDFGLETDRLALFGYSAGGHLACLLAAQMHSFQSSPPVRLVGVVAGGAPCDFSWIPSDNRALAYWLGGSRQEVPHAYDQATPLEFVSADDPPLFLYHGQDDQLVPLASPRRMVERMVEAGVGAQLHVVPGKGHVGTLLDAPAWEKGLEFLLERLNSSPQTPADDDRPSTDPASSPASLPPSSTIPQGGR